MAQGRRECQLGNGATPQRTRSICVRNTKALGVGHLRKRNGSHRKGF